MLHVTATTTVTFSAQHFFFFFEFLFFISVIWLIQIFYYNFFLATTSVLSIGCTSQRVSNCISYLFFSVILRKTVWTKEQYTGVTNGGCKGFEFYYWPEHRDNLFTQFKKIRNNSLDRNDNINAFCKYGLANVRYGLANISNNFSMLLRTGSLPNTKTVFSFTIPYSLNRTFVCDAIKTGTHLQVQTDCTHVLNLTG